ncbi:MAG: hypothetical protein KF871_10850 [Hydrogenophaga sp.]|uniref:hypothetical protein n=1 Tax=Hydrogenophaga sp. TaxID=1904254 RepID=UPI001D593D0F|nr:hypothetical protein [Hydrogenophaga sp.]MBX3610380.1 hypothetical protein [Hydrogenophaga sp.]
MNQTYPGSPAQVEAAAMDRQMRNLGSLVGQKQSQSPRVIEALDDLRRALSLLDDVAGAVADRTQVLQRPSEPSPVKDPMGAGQIRAASSNLVMQVEDCSNRVHAIVRGLQDVLQRLEV